MPREGRAWRVQVYAIDYLFFFRSLLSDYRIFSARREGWYCLGSRGLEGWRARPDNHPMSARGGRGGERVRGDEMQLLRHTP